MAGPLNAEKKFFLSLEAPKDVSDIFKLGNIVIGSKEFEIPDVPFDLGIDTSSLRANHTIYNVKINKIPSSPLHRNRQGSPLLAFKCTLRTADVNVINPDDTYMRTLSQHKELLALLAAKPHDRHLFLVTGVVMSNNYSYKESYIIDPFGTIGYQLEDSFQTFPTPGQRLNLVGYSMVKLELKDKMLTAEEFVVGADF